MLAHEPTGRRTRVLIAEDDESLRALMRLTVAGADIEIVEAQDGTEALAAARSAPPDIVLLDWMMPGLSGIDVCRALRADPATADATVVMVTARVLPAEREAAYAAGVDHYLGKPFSPAALLETVRRAL